MIDQPGQPAALDLAATPLVGLDQLEFIANGIDHAEGICVTLDGALYVSGEAGQIYRVADDGTASEVASTGGWTLGLAADAAGRIYACDPKAHCVWRLDPVDWRPEVFTAGPEGKPLATPNWGAFGRDGSYYFSDSGGWKTRDGAILVVRPGDAVRAGGATEIWTRESRDFPNGLAVSPDGRELWVLESTPGRLVRFAIRPDGTAGGREVLVDLPRTVPDGIAFATDGSVVIACYRPDVVLRWRADIGVQVLASDPEGTALAGPTNCVFYGPGRATIAVPNIGRWHVTRFRVPGLSGVPLFYPTDDQLGE
jgi:gluconolactonase